MADAKRDVAWVLGSMLATVVGFRTYLHGVDHNSDLFIAGYNVHHLFTGAILAIAAAMMLAIGVATGLRRRAAQFALGAGAAMVLDEIVFLIVTDGSNDSYLTGPSWGGAVVSIAVAAVWIVFLGWRGRRQAE